MILNPLKEFWYILIQTGAQVWFKTDSFFKKRKLWGQETANHAWFENKISLQAFQDQWQSVFLTHIEIKSDSENLCATSYCRQKKLYTPEEQPS